MRQITARLKNGQDLRNEIEKIAKANDIRAGALLSVVGGLKKAVLRAPVIERHNPIVKTWDVDLEIVSGTGTVSRNGSHVHISVSDGDGATFGGHLQEGCIVRSTAEVVILIFDDVEYKRLPDQETGYDELVVQ